MVTNPMYSGDPEQHKLEVAQRKREAAKKRAEQSFAKARSKRKRRTKH